METNITEIAKEPVVEAAPDVSTAFGVSLRGWIALITILTVCLMSGLSIKIEEPLYTLAGLIVGFYFGQNVKKST